MAWLALAPATAAAAPSRGAVDVAAQDARASAAPLQESPSDGLPCGPLPPAAPPLNRAGGREGALVQVPVQRVRYLQALAEDGAAARPQRMAGAPAQHLDYRTTS